MNERILKQLAELSIAPDGGINESVRAYVLQKLSRADIKRYVLYLRNVLRDRIVTVRTPAVVDTVTKERLQALFPGKELRYAADSSLGAGLRVEYGDNVVDVNVRNMLDKTIRRLKEKT